MVTKSNSGQNRKRTREIAKRNPSVNVPQVDRTLAVLDTLRELGLEGPSYDLESPYGGRAFHSTRDDEQIGVATD